MKNFWKDEDVERLREEWAKAASDEELVRIFPDRTIDSIWSKAARLKLGTRKYLDSGKPQYRHGFWTPEKQKILEDMWMAGSSTRQIGNEIGATRNAVIGRINRCGLSQPVIPAKLKQYPVYRPRSCQWIEGEPPEAYSYCGADVEPGRSYCKDHHAICYQAGTARPRYGQHGKTTWGGLQLGLVS